MTRPGLRQARHRYDPEPLQLGFSIGMTRQNDSWSRSGSDGCPEIGFSSILVVHECRFNSNPGQEVPNIGDEIKVAVTAYAGKSYKYIKMLEGSFHHVSMLRVLTWRDLWI